MKKTKQNEEIMLSIKNLVLIFIILSSIINGNCQNNKIEKFKFEIYGTKKIIVPYQVCDIDSLHNNEAKDIYKVINKYNVSFANILNIYFSNSYVKENFKYKQKFCHGFLYLKGEDYFNEYIEIIKLEHEIGTILNKLINEDDHLARISIFRDDSRYFSKSFEIISGFESIPNIDHFRIRSAHYGRVLKQYEYGEKVVENKDKKIIGYFENNISYQINIPVFYNNIYVADAFYTFYK